MDAPQTPASVTELSVSESPLQSSEPTDSTISSPAVRRQTADGESQRKKSKSNICERAATFIQPEKKVAPDPAASQSFRAIIFASYSSVLLVCVPISWALNFALPHQHTLVFVFSFLAIIPLVKLLAFATDEMSMRVGQALAGFMNASVGNSVGLSISIIALVRCKLDIAQSSLVGSILSNLLLVLGTCFFVGGLRLSEQGFIARVDTTLLTIGVVSVLLPGAFLMVQQGPDINLTDYLILKLSHGVAILLLFIYGLHLYFFLFSHKVLYRDDSEIIASKRYSVNPFRRFNNGEGVASQCTEMGVFSPQQQPQPAALGDSAAYATAPVVDPESGRAHDEEHLETPRMNIAAAIGLLIVIKVLVVVTADILVGSISGLTAARSISREFVGIILLPIVGTAAQHVTAATLSFKDELTLSLSVAIGSSIQNALFVIPFVVILGWILEKPLTLLFDPLYSIVMFLSVITVNQILRDCRLNWLKGMVLICLYLMLCVIFWYYPGACLFCSGARLSRPSAEGTLYLG